VPDVEVRGLRELQGAFRTIDRDLPKELRLHLKDIATHVVGVVQQRMPFGTGEAARSVKPRATQRGAGIAFPAGGKPWRDVKADYYPWLDFGGKVGRGRSIVRPVVKGGRYIYPAIAESRGYIETEVNAAVEVVAEHAGFETRNG